MAIDVHLSIIIPIFNVERYFSSCIDSLLNTPGIENSEIILVNDGSTDKSGLLADTYAKNYDNVIVINTANNGPSAARNTGLNIATGKYVFFCDSDDMVVPELFARIISLANTSDHDIFLWDSDICYVEGENLPPKNRGYFAREGLEKTEKTYTGVDFLKTLLQSTGNFLPTVWLGAYKRSFLMENDLFFVEGIIFEDELWVPKTYLSASSILYIPQKIYIYRLHNGSITNPVSTSNEDILESYMKVYPSLYDYYDKEVSDDILRKLIEGDLTKRYLRRIIQYRAWRYKLADKIDTKILWRTALKIKHKIAVLLVILLIIVFKPVSSR